MQNTGLLGYFSGVNLSINGVNLSGDIIGHTLTSVYEDVYTRKSTKHNEDVT